MPDPRGRIFSRYK